mgnify:FL=1|jgi:hypothetical protein|tara:strand:+ start:21 stop:653 length:633 start_codon:yes stop_codon:yes gene_type:complete
MSFAITLGVIGIGTKVFGAVQSYNALKEQAGKDKERAKNQQELLQNLENSRQTLTNPYASLGVATQAAEIQIEQTDIALANTLDTIRATGGGAGGATALAQAALQSKKGVSATIEKQEAENERMRAEGEVGLQNMRETRENAKLDRYSALSDQATIQARASANGQTMAKQAMFDLGADSLMATASGLSGVGGTTGTEAIDNLVDPNAKTD